MQFNPSPYSYQQAGVGVARPNPGQISKGATGSDVKLLQKKLAERGYGICESDSSSGSVSCDWQEGKFDSYTDRAVRDFQKDKKLGVDGIVGRKTWKALGETSAPAPVAAVTQFFESSVLPPAGAAEEAGGEPFYKKPWFLPVAISGSVLLIGTIIILVKD
jgi:peptidoglycan hydrolase-like protein with peptidoglycan-binding domain